MIHPLLRLLLRLGRLAALAFAAWLLHVASDRRELASEPPAVTLDQARRLLPGAARLAARDPVRGGHHVFDTDGRPLGYVLTTSPQTDDLVGYSGPNNVLVALDPEGRVAGAELLASGDTPAHVADVRRHTPFWRRFTGWTPATQPPPAFEAVSGSTLTSLGIAEAVERRLAGRAESLRFPEPVTLDDIRGLLPAATALRPDDQRPGWQAILDSQGRRLGFAVRSSPQAETVRGHGGPTEALALLDPEGRTVRAVRLRRSYDSADYVDRVRDDAPFLAQLAGRTIDEWARLDFQRAGIEGVSGATETSYAVAEGLRRRFAADLLPAPPARASRSSWKFSDTVLALIVAGSLAMAFTPLRGRPLLRRAWQGVLVVGLGFWSGGLLSLALLGGWAEHGVARETAPGLVLLAAVALLVPWLGGRQLYCHHLCPHGAVQEWLAGCHRLRVAVPARLGRLLEALPVLLLAVACLAPLAGWSINRAHLEPFDAWSLTRTATVSAVIAVVGLAASLFVPLAYCRYGCPTGALLRFLRHRGTADRPDTRDATALALLAAGAALVLGRPIAPASASGTGPTATREVVVLGGRAFGTTWSVRLRDPVADPAALERTLAAELERLESTLSHWRPTSATAQFNASATTLPVELPPELVDLVARCLAISAASDGAFDITVAPLVRAWGFGPGGAPPSPPNDTELHELLGRCGWRKLTADTQRHTLRKSHPGLQLDLGAILQGYAADRLGALLRESGHPGFLIDIGGELLAGGTWEVAVEDPVRPGGILRPVRLLDAALATSGTYRTRRTDAGRPRSHLVDPRTGQPVGHDTVLAAVHHPSAAEADAWATALLVLGEPAASDVARDRHLDHASVSRAGSEWRANFSPSFPAAYPETLAPRTGPRLPSTHGR